MKQLQTILVAYLFPLPYTPCPARPILLILRTTRLCRPRRHHPRKNYTMHFKARWPQNKHVDVPLHRLPLEVPKQPRKIARKSMLDRACPDRTSCINILHHVALDAIEPWLMM